MQINNLLMHLKFQKNKNEIKTHIRKEIIKIRAVVNETDNKRTSQKVNKTKSWFFQRINKMGVLLANFIKKASNQCLQKLKS